jgi:signal transduction histidine kinase
MVGTTAECGHEKTRVQLFYAMTAIGVLILAMFGARALIVHETATGAIECAAAFLTIVNIVIYFATGNMAWAARFLHIVLAVVLLSIGRIEKDAQTGILLWYYVFPPLTIFLSGALEGVLWSGIALAVAVVLMAYRHGADQYLVYSGIFIFRYIAVYAVIVAMAYSFERVRIKARSGLDLSEEESSRKNEELRMLLSSISDVVFSIDTNGILIRIFKPYEHSAFIDLPNEFIGQAYNSVLPEKLVIGLDQSISRLKASESTIEFPYEIGFGPERAWFLAKISVMKNVKGAIYGYTVVARNITLQRREELKRKALEEDLLRSEQKAIIGRVAAGVAHEINNPAAAITSDVSTMLQLAQRLPEVQEKSEIIEILRRDGAAIARVTDIVSAVKGAYRPQKWHSIDLKREIELQLTLLRKEYKDRIVIQREYFTTASIDAYGSEVGQILLNVLNNAIDAITDKGTITIRTAETEDRVSVAITDTGKGIPDNQLPHIFEPFYTTKEVGKGTGLGLSISYSIAKRHNGTLIVSKTEPQKGTTFLLELPKKRIDHEKI